MRYIAALIAGFALLITPAAFATGGKPGDGKRERPSFPHPNEKTKQKVVCHKGKTQSMNVHAVPSHLAHGDTLGSCKPNSGNGGSSVVVKVPVPSGGARILLCMPYPVMQIGGWMSIAADLNIKETASKPWTDGQLARFYPGTGATCENRGGHMVTPGYFIRGVDAQYPVWVE